MRPQFGRIAAKFRRDEAGTTVMAFHPLICHMLDVAAVTEALWDGMLPQPAKELLSEALGLSEEESRGWVSVIAGAHDLGKASRPFQAKDSGHGVRLAGTGLSASPDIRDPGHGLVTTVHLGPLLERVGIARMLATRLSTITGGHHGLFMLPARGAGERGNIDERDPKIRHTWERAREGLFDELMSLLKPSGVPSGAMPNSATMLLAGLISVADWIGSNEEFYPYNTQSVDDLSGYLGSARAKAHGALRHLHWLSYAPPLRPSTFADLFGFAPRPLQTAAEAVVDDSHEPGLVIIEAPMGEGKTEAALLLVDRWNAVGHRGGYVALPTQATANQLHGRVASFLSERFTSADINLMLVHGGAGLLDDVEFLPTNVDAEQDHGAVAAGEWFLPRKRSLLAPWGVGTVDQVLMAVLQVRHGFVRLFGLAAKPVVVDEVHAYDTYMTGLLERLLEWLGALGSPVVLLSATLPTVRRQALMTAYLKGRGNPFEVSPAVTAPYPRITWTSRDAVQTQGFPATRARELHIGRVDDAPEAVVGLLRRELVDGGCAVVICNTVARAQYMYRALLNSGVFAADQLDLFHARFLLKDRQKREQRNIRRFGPPSAESSRPNRFVLVATQVVEQSLDLDFDVMVTDMAPVDLLLQRSGRLQRHERRERRHPLVLHIRWPDGVPPKFDGSSTAVYDEHILLRTWRSLQNRGSIHVPSDLQDLIDTVYSDSEDTPTRIEPELAIRWNATWTEMRSRQAMETREAEWRRLRTPVGPPSHPGELLSSQQVREEDAEDLHPRLQALTRLTEPSASVVVLRPGDQAIEASRRPSRDEARDLLRRSVSVSHRGLVQELLRRDVPSGWAGTAWLRQHRLLVIGNEPIHVGAFAIDYDSEIGLMVEREERQSNVGPTRLDI